MPWVSVYHVEQVLRESWLSPGSVLFMLIWLDSAGKGCIRAQYSQPAYEKERLRGSRSFAGHLVPRRADDLCLMPHPWPYISRLLPWRKSVPRACRGSGPGASQKSFPGGALNSFCCRMGQAHGCFPKTTSWTSKWTHMVKHDHCAPWR